MQLKPGIVANVAVASLERDPNQPRRTFDADGLKALGASLALRIEVPLKVRQEGKRLVIVDGERRWRAAKLAKLDKLPCLLAELEDKLDIAASQLTTSEQREALKPIDVAEFLVGLQKREKKSSNELLAALGKMGLDSIGKAKMDKIMRLVELPDWAKEQMRAGVMSESAAIALLPAVGFPNVLKHIHGATDQQIKWSGSVSVKEAEESIDDGFRMTGVDLNKNWGDPSETRAFPIKVCYSCEFYKKLGKTELCMNAKEFKKRNAEALLLRAEKESEAAQKRKSGVAAVPRAEQTDRTQVEPRKLKMVPGTNVVMLKRMDHMSYRSLGGMDTDFDLTECQTCPHRHLADHNGKAEHAEDHCFHPPCHGEKNRLHRRQETRHDKMRLHLEAFLRPAILAKIPTYPQPIVQGLQLWLATAAVDHGDSNWISQNREAVPRETEQFLKERKLFSLAAVMEYSNTMQVADHRALTAAAINVMSREQLRWFALQMQFDLNDKQTFFRIDETYLKMKRRAELGEFARIIGLETIADLSVALLKQKLLHPDAVDKIGVPADVERLYREPFAVERPEFDDDDLDGFDEGAQDMTDEEREDMESAELDVPAKTKRKRA